jgi:hypothetical protein
MILWEVVAYLADDARRTVAFEALRLPPTSALNVYRRPRSFRRKRRKSC